ncbi:MAG: hypothetical protein JW716_03380 [Candidatus Aenigmarchaeota archaeon]|nr:hypothetical protein [Candidatus Aenigmarchaeota archaeon]
MKRKDRKGAFQLSLGFIIGLIFAVILLTLSISWIQGTFVSMEGLTTDLTGNAKDTLSKTFEQTKTNFDVSPSYFELAPGDGLKFSAGVKNDHKDGNTHTFVIRAFPGTAESIIVDGWSCDDFETCTDLQEEMASWITYIKAADNVPGNEKMMRDITIKFPNNVRKGDYMFRVIACIDKSHTECEAGNWGSAKTITLRVK